MLLRRERPADADAIRAVHKAAFHRPERGEDVPEARLIDLQRADESWMEPLSLVAVADGAIVGHVVCTRAHVDSVPVLALGPIGVVPEQQGKGVGSALMHAVLAAAEALDEPAVLLYGSPKFYPRFGFELAEPRGIGCPDPEAADAFQIRVLNRAGEELRGDFRFSSAFDRMHDDQESAG